MFVRSNSTLFIPINPYNSTLLAKFTFVSCSTLRIGPYLFYIEKCITQSKQRIGYRARFRQNNDLPLWRGLAVKKAVIFNARVKLCTVDSQCNTGK